MSLQIKLLRVLEERVVEPLGGNKIIPFTARIIAATKVDLMELSEVGKFRADLYYRLNVLNVKIPPLRDIPDDIPLFFEHFLLIAANTYSMDVPSVAPARRQWLLSHDWPGGARELRNLATCCVLLGADQAFDNYMLAESGSALTLAEQVSRFEESLIREALTRCAGRINEAQESLGLARKTLYEKMRKYNLDKSQFRE